MKLLRMRTLGVFGLGFLAGSRAGRGPWDKAQATAEQLKGKMSGGSTGDAGSTAQNGFEGQYTKANPRMTEV